MTRNLSKTQCAMTEQRPNERIYNFDEVAKGYDETAAIEEAKRCLQCKNKPCVSGCPVQIDIPSFIKKTAEGDFDGAYEILTQYTSLPAVCGRVCPQETQCEGKCVRGAKEGCEAVAIGRIERFVADYRLRSGKKSEMKREENGKKTAVIGSGPASLACAAELRRRGYAVTVFEALHEIGGVLTYGIPEFRLPKSVVQAETDELKRQGVEFITDAVVGKTLDLHELKEKYGYLAIFIGTGAGLPKFMGIEGENLNGVYSANEFLTRSNLMQGYRKDSATPLYCGKEVAVIGGGNVAMDAARTARRLGANVRIVYRRSEAELPARREEVRHAKEEGVIFEMLTAPIKLMQNDVTDKKALDYGFVCGMECVRMELGEKDERGRRMPRKIEDSNFFLPVDTVIMALGTSPNPLLKNATPDLKTRPHGEIETDETGKTSIEGVYCGGDAATGAATVIKAMGAGKEAAKRMDEYLRTL